VMARDDRLESTLPPTSTDAGRRSNFPAIRSIRLSSAGMPTLRVACPSAVFSRPNRTSASSLSSRWRALCGPPRHRRRTAALARQRRFADRLQRTSCTASTSRRRSRHVDDEPAEDRRRRRLGRGYDRAAVPAARGFPAARLAGSRGFRRRRLRRSAAGDGRRHARALLTDAASRLSGPFRRRVLAGAGAVRDAVGWRTRRDHRCAGRGLVAAGGPARSGQGGASPGSARPGPAAGVQAVDGESGGDVR